MKKNPWSVPAAVLIGCFTVVACGSDSEAEGLTDETVETTDDADVVDSDAGADDPAVEDDDPALEDGDADASTDGEGESGIGVPLPPSADAVSTTESGPLTVVQFIVPLSEQQATISFYDDWTDSQADTYIRSEAESGGVSWQNDPEPGSDAYIIAVLSPLEGDDFITVTLTVGTVE